MMDLKSNILTGWIVNTITLAYGPGVTPGMETHAHNILEVNALWVRFYQAQISEVIQAAAWLFIFTSCYLKDIVRTELYILVL